MAARETRNPADKERRDSGRGRFRDDRGAGVTDRRPELSPELYDGVDQWLASRRGMVLSALVALSVVLRIGYFVEIANSPLAVQHHWTQSDMNFFDRWAKEIVAGDWLSENVTPPFHQWHYSVTREYLESHPDVLARLRPRAAEIADSFFEKNSQASRALEDAYKKRGRDFFDKNPAELANEREKIVASGLLWYEWVGQRQFYQEPLYPYLVALTYKIVGPDVRFVFAWQLLLGVLTNVLVYLITRRYFGDIAAVLAGLLSVFYGPLMHFEMVLVRETFIIFFGVFLVWLTSLAIDRKTWRWWFAVGLAMGTSLLIKSHFALYILGVLAMLAAQYRKNFAALWRFEIAGVVGVLLGLSPLVVRNIALGVSPLATTGASGVVLVLGCSGYVGAGTFVVQPAKIVEIISETGGRMIPSVLASIELTGQGAYLRSLWEKFSCTWHWWAPPDNVNFYYYRLHAASLYCTAISFLQISPLALVGLVLALRRKWRPRTATISDAQWEPATPLYLLMLTNLAVMLLFFVQDRYRMPLTVAVIPFSALAIVLAFQWLCDRQWAKVGVILAVTVCLAVWVGRPLPPNTPLIRLADYFLPYPLYYDPMVKEARDAGDHLKAAKILADSLKFEPEEVRQIGVLRGPANAFEVQLASSFADVHRRCAGAYAQAGCQREAAAELQRANELMGACMQK